MSKSGNNIIEKNFHRFSNWVAKATGSPAAFFSALTIVILWAISGRFFHYSEVWQMIINTGTTIITFLMIFIIQQSQNKDTTAIHLKLNELIASNKNTSNRLVASEDMTPAELEVIKKYYRKLSEKSNDKESVYAIHSFDEKAEDTEKSEAKSKDMKEKQP
ncbi:hypothetical protein BH11BAC4_BH11BAC4_08750 [soil metagenome]